jgi:hypothetical protein
MKGKGLAKGKGSGTEEGWTKLLNMLVELAVHDWGGKKVK